MLGTYRIRVYDHSAEYSGDRPARVDTKADITFTGDDAEAIAKQLYLTLREKYSGPYEVSLLYYEPQPPLSKVLAFKHAFEGSGPEIRLNEEV